MNINKISVKKLFGFLDHEIPLHNYGVTIIHGPNGCGKTSVLKLVSSFFSGEYQSLKKISFGEMYIYFADETYLKVVKTIDSQPSLITGTMPIKRQKTILSVSYHKATEEQINSVEIDADAAISKKLHRDAPPPSMIDEYFPYLRRVGSREWRDIKSGRRFSYHELIDIYLSQLNLELVVASDDWLQNIIQQNKVYFTQTQRLIKLTSIDHIHKPDEGRTATDVVEFYSNEICGIIKEKLAESVAVSQAKDRSFPERLLLDQLPNNIAEENLREKYAATELRIKKLVDAGLLDDIQNISLPEIELGVTEKKVLALYLQDTNEKMNVFDDLQKKIETLMSVVGTKMRSTSFKIDRQQGFVFKSLRGDATDIKPTELSSGEQHQLVLFYELIFKSEGSSLFLIDEPEISLHVEWQRQFLDDIKQISELGGHKFIIATHSPQIIHNRRDLTVPLEGGVI